jgi:ABC-type glycerol-3-phosphate transport system substrate-binding protein
MQPKCPLAAAAALAATVVAAGCGGSTTTDTTTPTRPAAARAPAARLHVDRAATRQRGYPVVTVQTRRAANRLCDAYMNGRIPQLRRATQVTFDVPGTPSDVTCVAP